ncbi:lactate utilization protein [Desulfotomaculum copahuensis]|uniref:Lactate utilization protein C n=1 Tax=Desulfotomaculum copahuensis TaxID=1838280 RepID=A0A1B7LIU0_9FIRM|nr:lactate utilization protein [Desulfotomaculum copahuensis]OAT86466.1 lactate utilization protein C [Desulfotomaculum copahuensis]
MSTLEELVNWNYEQKCLKAVEALNKNGFKAVYCRTRQEAFDYILKEAREAETIGFGGSLSVAALKVADALKEAGKKLHNHNTPGLTPEERLSVMRQQLTCDLFLTGANAVTLSGFLVNIDATGNRVGAMTFGPGKVIVVAGHNKLAADKEHALQRIKACAAPPNAKRLNLNTPCARTGLCADCNSPDRICRITTVIERKPKFTDVHVLVVNEEMGL